MSSLEHSATVGYLACLLAVFCFGSNYVPAKNIALGDGFFFQFIMCNAIFLTSIPVVIYLEYPEFHPFAMLGGVCWATGIMLSGPIIQLIGLGLGLLVWGSMNMLMGWASGTFGLFGLKAEYIDNRPLNYFGVTLAMVGFIIFLFVKSESQTALNEERKASNAEERRLSFAPPMIPQNDTESNIKGAASESTALSGTKTGYSTTSETNGEYSKLSNHADDGYVEEVYGPVFGDDMLAHHRRFLGLFMACVSGIFFGVSFDPAQWIIDNVYDGNDSSLNYIFPSCLGGALTSWFYFIIYILNHRYHDTDHYMDSSIIGPGLFAGLLWGIANISWFIANGAIGFSITFPIIAFGPGFVGALWGIFYFKEIRGRQNLLILGAAFIVLFFGLMLVAWSH